MYLLFLAVAIMSIKELNSSSAEQNINATNDDTGQMWLAPSLLSDNSVEGKQRAMVIYGQDLVAHTSIYFGPHGTVAQSSNGMNCQNCHLDAGTRAWGNNFGAVVSTYPKFRARSGKVEDITKRVNDCFIRSLNGRAIDSAGYEMQSIVAYMKWLGQNVNKGEKPAGTGIMDLPYLTRPASTQKGQIIYNNQCQSCHAADGQGILNARGNQFLYPPLWGPNSYNDGAGLYRLSRLAGYVKNNMPFNSATYLHPVLSNEDAWDVAAFVNSQPRPSADKTHDWPSIADKPFDHPFGPYADGFSEQQHKFGTYQPIIDEQKSRLKSTLAKKSP